MCNIHFNFPILVATYHHHHQPIHFNLTQLMMATVSQHEISIRMNINFLYRYMCSTTPFPYTSSLCSQTNNTTGRFNTNQRKKSPILDNISRLPFTFLYFKVYNILYVHCIRMYNEQRNTLQFNSILALLSYGDI